MNPGRRGTPRCPRTCAGEIGIFGGYFLLEEQVAQVRQDFDAICAPFRRPDGKLHVAELGPIAQQLREQVFAYLGQRNIACVYEAIHAQGYHVEYLRRKDRDPHTRPLHAELMLGLFTKALAYREEKGLTDRQIKVLTDRIDRPVVAGFNKAIREFLGVSSMKETVTRYLPDTKTLQKLEVTWDVKYEFPKDWDFQLIEAGDYAIEIDITNGSLTAAADVVVGSLRYFFESRQGRRLGDASGAFGLRQRALAGGQDLWPDTSGRLPGTGRHHLLPPGRADAREGPRTPRIQRSGG